MGNVEFKKLVLGQMQLALKPEGVRKNGNTFSSAKDDVVVFIQLQSGVKSSKDQLLATVNLGVFSRTLAIKLGNTRQANILDAHWSERLGFLLPKPHDKWWEINSEAEAKAAGQEINEILTTRALPELREVASTQKLEMLWNTGKSPGLTEYLRQQYLKV